MSIEEIAIGFVMGALSSDHRKAVFVERLHNRQLDERIFELESLLAPVSEICEPDPVPERLWGQIESSLTSELATFADKCAESFHDGSWQPHGSGIVTKSLWSEGTALVRCDPGSFEVGHEQPSDQDEHIMVIAGDLRLGGRSFITGDYICVPAGSVHQRMDTIGGCILFIQYKNAHS